MSADRFFASVTAWAARRDDVYALALVGSYARGDARPDSDIDVVLIVADPARYLTDTSWVSAFGSETTCAVEDWGTMTSVRVAS